MTVSLAQAADGLGTMCGLEKARELLSRAGLTQIDIHQLEHDFQNDYYVIQKQKCLSRQLSCRSLFLYGQKQILDRSHSQGAYLLPNVNDTI